MKNLLIVALTIMLASLASTALADRGAGYGHGDRYDRGDRIDHRLDARGDRVEARYDRKVVRSVFHNRHGKAPGHMRAYRHTHRKAHYASRHQYCSIHGVRHDHRYDDRVRLGIYVPGLWFSGTWHD